MDDPCLATSLAAARDTVLVEPRPDLATVVLRGSERVAWLNGLVTCDLATRPSGEATYGLLLEKKGKIRADLLVVDEGDTLVIVVPAAARAAVVEALDHHLSWRTSTRRRAARGRAPARRSARVADLPASRPPPTRGGARLARGAARAGRRQWRRLPTGARALGGGRRRRGGRRARRRAVRPQFGSDFDGGYYPRRRRWRRARCRSPRAVTSARRSSTRSSTAAARSSGSCRSPSRATRPAPGAAVLDEAGAPSAPYTRRTHRGGLRAIALRSARTPSRGRRSGSTGRRRTLAPPPPLVGAP